jgi:hypothetical protein
VTGFPKQEFPDFRSGFTRLKSDWNVKISSLQAVEANRVVRRRDSHVFEKIGPQKTVRLTAVHTNSPFFKEDSVREAYCPAGHSAPGRMDAVATARSSRGTARHECEAACQIMK